MGIFLYQRTQHLSARQRVVDALADVSGAHMFLEFRLMHQKPRLLSRSAKNQASPRFMHHIRQFLERLQSSGIDRRHIPQAQNDDGWQFGKLGNDFIQLIRGAEKKRPMDPKNCHVVGNLLMLENMHVTFSNVFVSYLRDRRRCRHFSYEDKRRQDHAHFDGHG